MSKKRISFILIFTISIFLGVTTIAPLKAATTVNINEKKLFTLAPGYKIACFDIIQDKCLVFSPDASEFAYIQERISDGRQLITRNDNNSEGEYDEIAWLKFSPDGQHLVYAGSEAEGEESFFIFDDYKYTQPYNLILPPVFSLDSTKYAYPIVNMTEDNGEIVFQSRMIVNNIAGKEYEKVYSLTYTVGLQNLFTDIFIGDGGFSRDSQRLAYKVEDNGKQFFVVDNQEQKKYDHVSSFHFSSDSERFAYLANLNSRYLLVIDGIEEDVESETTALDFRNIIKERHRSFFSEVEYELSDLLNNKINEYIESYNITDKRVCAKDDISCAYTNDNRSRVIQDDVPGKDYGAYHIVFDSLIFDANGNLFFIAEEKDEQKDMLQHFLVVNGKESKRYDKIWPALRIEPLIDFFYVGSLGQDFFRLSIDSKEESIKADLQIANTDSSLSTRLKGRILLQVESHGEAWYVNPTNSHRYYLRDGVSAYGALRKFGLGITNADLAKIPVGIEERFEDVDTDGDGLADKLEEGLGTDINKSDTDGDGNSDYKEVINQATNPLGSGRLIYDNNLINSTKGKILLQVESRGEAWYIHPVDGKRYYMKDGDAAYQIMRFLSLGINNDNLEKIQVGEF